VKNPKIELFCGDTMCLDEDLRKRSINTKFDLITIGEALHWFDHYKLFEYINTKLMDSEGTFCVLSYCNTGCEYNITDKEFSKKAQAHYDKFYLTVKDSFESNQDSIYSGYSDIEFSKYYKNVVREKYVEEIPMSLTGLIGYFKTWSGYNTYIIKMASQENFADPAEVMREGFERDLKEYFEKSGEQINELVITLITPYFYIECSNK